MQSGATMRAIFVFGSNLAGRHGAGAARCAHEKYGAIYGQGIGLQGNSYAIPTKSKNLVTLPILDIYTHVQNFMKFAKENPALRFNLTRIGCGLAGYKDSDIAWMFKDAPDNVAKPKGW